MGHGSSETSRFHDYGNAFRYENVEAGSCDLEHRQNYMKYQGKWVHLREKWMPGTHVTCSKQHVPQPQKSTHTNYLSHTCDLGQL